MIVFGVIFFILVGILIGSTFAKTSGATFVERVKNYFNLAR